MMSIRSLADFNGSSPGRCGDWLTPPPSPPGPQPPGRHDERGMGTFNWPPAGTTTRPHTGTFSWPRTASIPERGVRALPGRAERSAPGAAQTSPRDERVSADLSDHSACSGVAGVRLVARIGLHDHDVRRVTGDHRAILGDRSGYDHA